MISFFLYVLLVLVAVYNCHSIWLVYVEPFLRFLGKWKLLYFSWAAWNLFFNLCSCGLPLGLYKTSADNAITSTVFELSREYSKLPFLSRDVAELESKSDPDGHLTIFFFYIRNLTDFSPSVFDSDFFNPQQHTLAKSRIIAPGVHWTPCNIHKNKLV